MAASRRPIKVLNVAEKPSVAKTVSTILSGNQGFRTREGRSRYNKIFEFNYMINEQPCHMVFTSVTGHLMEIDFEPRYRKWHSCDPLDLFHAPICKYVPEDKVDIKRTLEEEARKCQWLVLWLDCDPEGENIAFEVVEVCLSVNSHLTIKRATFSTLTTQLHEKVKMLVQPDQFVSAAIDVRQEVDLRIGASFTRFLTMLLKDAFVFDVPTDGTNLILSYGPCQFPTLGFVVERYWEILAHEPEEFWKIQCSHTTDEGTANFSWMRGHLFDHTCAVLLYEMCVQEPIATVTNILQKEEKKLPPYPLNTLELEKRASRYFRMSSEQTMKIAEELYQSGFISYPRTETDLFSEGTDLRILVQEQQEHPVWGPYAQRLLDPSSGLWMIPLNGGHDDKAHPPIHPTKFSPGEPGWSENHKKVYELVVRHYLACVSQPAVGAGTTVDIDIAGEMFSARGRIILARNYLDVYRFEKWGGSLIPSYTIGQQFTPTSMTLESGITRPPPLLSESDLLELMFRKGIGTDATMHDHIKKLTDRFYATKEALHFKPTNLGEALVMGYDDMRLTHELWKPELRSMMEKYMKDVGGRKMRKDDALASCLQIMKTCFLDARLNKVKLFEAFEIYFDRTNRTGGDEQHNHGQLVRKCDVCQESELFLRKKPDGKFMIGCLAFPQCRNVIWLPGSISEATVTPTVCDTCTPGPIFKIQFTFRQREIPLHFNIHHLGCVGGCDDVMRELIEISGFGRHNFTRAPATGRGTTAPSRNDPQNNQQRTRGRGTTAPLRNGSQNNPQQNTCSFCHQTGHSSSDCYSGTSQNRSSRFQRVNAHDGDPVIPCTTCGSPCSLKTANTEANRGRKFYSCQAQGCKFFVCWEDSVPSTRGGGSYSNNASTSAANTSRRGGRGGGRANSSDVRFVSATGDPVSGRSCFICGDPSHFANVCPNRAMRN
uniref:DNA topoisomerase 3-alpha n=1 Tax=Erigeron canadensis TaxID=72917 RepID=UPI001CB98F5A|nr:DNA topoisomerase 3-alpha [Erigeron canadensis]